jgi:hypothetical protein
VLRKKEAEKRVEKSRMCWNAKHLAISSEVATAFTIIFRV